MCFIQVSISYGLNVYLSIINIHYNANEVLRFIISAFKVSLTVCVLTCRLSMNTGDVPATVTLESVNSVTFTQDTDGNIILHCPQNGERHFSRLHTHANYTGFV